MICDQRLNQSRGMIKAWDLLDLSEDEVVGWLGEFGVVGAKRFTRRVNGEVENTATLLLTFNRASCPSKLQLDYVTYHVEQYIPNPLMCYRCGNYGHPEVRCRKDQVCLQCGKSKHEGQCSGTRWCVNCEKTGHSCLARECEERVKQKEICKIKTEQEISYAQAKQVYETTHKSPTQKAYATVLRTPSAATRQENELKEKVVSLEKKMEQMLAMLEKLSKRDSETLPTDHDAHDEHVETREQNRQETNTETADIETGDEILSEGEMENMNQESEGTHETISPRGNSETIDDSWQIVGGGKKTENNKNKTLSSVTVTGDDDDSPSPPITRAKGLQGKNISQQQGKRKSWKEGS